MIIEISLPEQASKSSIDLVANTLIHHGCKSIDGKNVVITNATRVSDLIEYLNEDKIFLLIVVNIHNYDQIRDFFDATISFQMKNVLFCNPFIADIRSHQGHYPRLQRSVDISFGIYYARELNVSDPSIFITFIHELLLQNRTCNGGCHIS